VCILYKKNKIKINSIGGMVFPKSAFGHLSLADMNGDYFLRPDRILGMFKFDESSMVATYNLDSADHIRKEISLDMKLESILNNKARVNKASIKKRMNEFLREELQSESSSSSSSSSSSPPSSPSPPSYRRVGRALIYGNSRVSPLFVSPVSHHQISSSSLSSQTLRQEDFKHDENDDDDYGELYGGRDNRSIQSEISALTPSNTSSEDVASAIRHSSSQWHVQPAESKDDACTS
jgi:hypothetical protein